MLRRLNTADLTLITIGAVIGSGIFRTPGLVAQSAHTLSLILLCWLIGGLMSIIGAFVFAELAARRPVDGGMYAYLRDAYHPLVGFLLPWSSLTFVYTGSTAAASVLFAGYLIPLFGWHIEPRIVAVSAIALVTFINVLGVRQGSTWQNILVALKVFGLTAIIVTGILIAHPSAATVAPLPQFDSNLALLAGLGVAMLGVLFSYNDFQSATFMSAETINPGRTIARGQIFGVLSIIAIYLLANVAYLRILGPSALAATATPAADVMRAAFGPTGAFIVGAAIATSTLGYISTAILLAPRIYFQMAADGFFFKRIAWISPKTHVPVYAILLHGAITAIIAASGTYEQIIKFITIWPWIFIALCACAIFIYRKRDAGKEKPDFMVPLHPWSTILLIATIVGIVIAVVLQSPLNALWGALIMLAGVFFYVWRRFATNASATDTSP